MSRIQIHTRHAIAPRRRSSPLAAKFSMTAFINDVGTPIEFDVIELPNVQA